MPDTPRPRRTLVAVVLAAFAGIALLWGLFSSHPRSNSPKPPVAQNTQSIPTETAAYPDAHPVALVPQPQAEAASLKREAVTIATQITQAYPDDALSYALLGSAYYNTGRSDDATRHLRRCLELNSGLAEAYEILARVSYEKGDLDEAIRLCQEALKRGPANPELLNQLGRAFMDLGNTAEARQTLEQAIKLPRPASESFYLLGQAFLQSGDAPHAKENFQHAIGLMPDHTQAYFGLYTACMRLGQSDQALQYREQFLKLEAIDRQSLTDRNAQEDTLTGLPLVRKTVARTFYGASQIHRLHEQPAKATEFLLRAAALDAGNAAYRSGLESLYVKRNALADGVIAFEQLAKAQPDNSLNFFFLGRLCDRLKQLDAADRAYRYGAKTGPGPTRGLSRACGPLPSRQCPAH